MRLTFARRVATSTALVFVAVLLAGQSLAAAPKKPAPSKAVPATAAPARTAAPAPTAPPPAAAPIVPAPTPAQVAPAPANTAAPTQAPPPTPAQAPPPTPAQAPPPTPVPPAFEGPPPEFQFVESWPAETTLDHPDIRDAAEIWVEMLNQATQSVDFAEFYASDDSTLSAGKLRMVLDALEAAAKRGVPIRFLCEEKFYKTYPEIIDRLSKLQNTQVRRLDSAAFDGGVLHCKYFIVNGQKAYIGSQNFDWRSLEQIQELGVEIDNWDFTRTLKEQFDLDWLIAGYAKPGAYAPGAAQALVDSLVASKRKNSLVGSLPLRYGQGDRVWIRPAFSPTGRLLNERYWDEPAIADLISNAADSVDVQLLTYNDIMKDGKRWDALRAPLREAAGRGVKIRMLVADWCKREPTLKSLQELAKTKNIEIRFMDIPPASRGFIPFARVAHAKYMVVDGKKFWVGTGNWEYDYFHKSRNVGVIGEGRPAARRLADFFDGNWTSSYAERLDPKKQYEAPRVAQ